MKIKADKDKMNLIANNIINASYEFGNKTQLLENEINEIINAWEGNDAKRYIELLNDNYVVNLRELTRIIEIYGKYIKDASKVYEHLEQGTIDKYTGGIF